VDVATIKLFLRSFPLYYAISTLQMLLVDPKFASIHEPTPGFDHFVLRQLSRTFEGGEPGDI
jgi:hypothetical protein